MTGLTDADYQKFTLVRLSLIIETSENSSCFGTFSFSKTSHYVKNCHLHESTTM